ncbi:hypothetical protein SDC9_169621 [bioreactor metagenome]|uniref:Uncharacterized protein n=1 Tax=bioreactor metagenome TaxID=1076179 RepID=A0A645G5T6_9ZZZZ
MYCQTQLIQQVGCVWSDNGSANDHVIVIHNDLYKTLDFANGLCLT